MNGSTARHAKSNTGPVAGHEEILHKRQPCFRPMVANLQIAFQNPFDCLVAKGTEAGRSIRRQGRFHSVHEGIDRARSKDLHRQRLEQRRNEHRLVGIQRFIGNALLRMTANESHDRHVRHFTARTARRRHENQLLPLHRFDVAIEKIQHRTHLLQTKKLAQIEDRTAANPDNARYILRRIPVYSLCHLIRRFAGTVLFLEQYMAR